MSRETSTQVPCLIVVKRKKKHGVIRVVLNDALGLFPAVYGRVKGLWERYLNSVEERANLDMGETLTRMRKYPDPKQYIDPRFE